MVDMSAQVMREFDRIYSVVHGFVAETETEQVFDIYVEPYTSTETGELLDVYVSLEEKDTHRVLWSTHADWFSSDITSDAIERELCEVLGLYSNWLNFWPDSDYAGAVLILRRDAVEETLNHVLEAAKIEREDVAHLLFQTLSVFSKEEALRAIRHLARLHNLLIFEQPEPYNL